MRNYEGTFRIRFANDKRGIYIERGVKASTLTAADVNSALDTILEHAVKNKCGVDRWSLYIPEVNDKLSKDDTQVPVSKIKAALKQPDIEVSLRAANWGKPRIYITPKVTVIKSKSNIIDIA